MDIKMFVQVCEKLPKPVLKKFGIEMDAFKWNKSTSIDLNDHKLDDVEELAKLLKPMVYEKQFKIKEANITYKDIQIWIRTRKKGGVEKLKARNCYTFFTLLVAFMRKVPGHRLYLKDPDRDVFHAYFVDEIKYHPKERTSWGERPAYTNVSCMYIDFGIVREDNFSFSDSDCFGLKVEEILLNADLFAETEELRTSYLAEKKRFDIIYPKVGKQYLATGVATNDTDSDDDDEDDFWKREKTIFLSREGQPANVVIDVFFETDKKEKEDKNADINKTFWLVGNNIGDTEKGDEVDPSEITGKKEEIEIPIHPFLSCFDLRRHMRLKIHVSQLVQYKYDDKLGDKLVLPKEHRVLIDSLVSANGVFKDVIKGKSGGSVIMCTGGPGLGKTLTSEVYSEVVKRPLYSVQCSQLGTDPDEIEKNILKIFKRSKRWKAILLLDEADVYIHKRGKDLQQNAIVGVFS